MSIHENPLHRPTISPRPRVRVLPSIAPEPASYASAADPSGADIPIITRSRIRSVAAPIDVAPPAATSQPVPAQVAEPAASRPQTKARKRGDRTGPNYDENGDYLVGKYRPPVAGQFQKGGAGNKKGPKAGEVDFIKAINKELGKKLPIKLGGKRVSKDVVQLIAHNLRAMIIEKNLGAMKIAAQWRLMGEAQGESAASPSVSAEQLDVINQLLSEAGYDANPVVRKVPGEPS